jgi:hypothetical protein
MMRGCCLVCIVSGQYVRVEMYIEGSSCAKPSITKVTAVPIRHDWYGTVLLSLWICRTIEYDTSLFAFFLFHANISVCCYCTSIVLLTGCTSLLTCQHCVVWCIIACTYVVLKNRVFEMVWQLGSIRQYIACTQKPSF